MGSKKAPRPKTAKIPGRGKRIGLTSALGPKATTALVIVTLAGGLWYGSHAGLAAKAKTPSAAVETRPDTTAATPASAKNPVAAKHDTVSAPAATEAAQTAKAPVTTLEGCLEKNGDAFRLKDASGADAPKSRSWKSGFLKKGTAAVTVVDTAESLGLANRVGTRVRVTGTLVDRDMQAHAIRRVASSCS